MKNLLFAVLVCLFCLPASYAQEIASHEYRRVAPGDMQEYLKRETTYWKKFAEEEIKKGNMTFWAVCQRIGGIDKENSPNILIINAFKDIDKGAEWNTVTDLFPGVKAEDINTWELSTTTDQVYVRHLGNHVERENADFKFVQVTYHNVKNTEKHFTLEKEKWKPMIEKAMKEGTTSIQGWGNAVIVSPRTPDFDYEAYSYDLFATSHAAMVPWFTEDHQLPDGFWDGFAENTEGKRHSHLYRIVAVVTDDDN